MHGEHPDPLTSCSTLVDLLRWRGEHQPARRAFTFLRDGEGDETHVSYGALDRGAQAVAALLQRETREGDRALLLYPSGLEYITAFLGCLYAAVIAVPAYPPHPRLERTLGRLRTIVQDAGPAVVLTTTSILPIGSQLAARDPAFAGIRWLAIDTVGEMDAGTWREPAIGGAALAFLQYTSGSTTAPRGVMVSHGNLMHNEALIQRAAELDTDSIAVSWLPLYHDMGLIGCVLQPIYTGFPCVLMAPAHFLQNPVRWLRAITRYRATVSGGPNFAYDLCSRQVKPDELAMLDLSSWRIAMNGAEPIWPATLDSFTATFEPCGVRREAFFPCYGLAEATLLVSGGPPADQPAVLYADKVALQQRLVTVLPGPDSQRTLALVGSGQVTPEQRVLIVDPQTRLPCLPGHVGEIWVAGPSVAQGYWNSPVATEETFRARLAEDTEGPFLRTGDLGFVHAGQLFVASRLKDLIIIRGGNYAPQDIERTAQTSHAALRPGGGIAFTVETGGDPQLVIVHEVLREHSPVDCEEVASAIRAAVAEEHELEVHAVVLVRIGTIPKTSSGKPQRQACRDQFLDGTLRQTGQSIRPARGLSPSDEEMAGVVLAALIGAEQAQRLPLLVTYLRQRTAAAAGIASEAVPADQPFTALGLDSLRLLQLKQRLETDLAVAVPLESFMDYPTAAELAASMVEALDRSVGAMRAEVAELTDEQVDARLAELTARGA